MQERKREGERRDDQTKERASCPTPIHDGERALASLDALPVIVVILGKSCRPVHPILPALDVLVIVAGEKENTQGQGREAFN